VIGILNWDIRANDTTLRVTAGNVSIDDQNVPAITASVSVPFDQELYDSLDPRQTPVPRVTLNGRLTEWASKTVADMSAYFDAEGRVTAGGVTLEWAPYDVGGISDLFGSPLHTFAATEPQTMSLDLHVREIDASSFDMTISLASDEALLTDWAITTFADEQAMAEAQSGLPQQQIRTWVDPWLSVILGYRLTPGTYDTTPLSAPAVDIFDGFVGKSAWDAMRPFLEDTDLKLRPRPSGRGFTLERPENSINSPAEHSWLFQDKDVNTVRHPRSRNGDWYDSASLYRPAAEGTSPGYPNGTHSRTFLEDWGGKKPNVSMASNIVRRTRNRGEFIDIAAPIQLGVFMRDEFVYVPVIGESTPEPWIVKSVSYDITSATMIIRGEKRY